MECLVHLNDHQRREKFKPFPFTILVNDPDALAIRINLQLMRRALECQLPWQDDIGDFAQKELSQASSDLERLMPVLEDLWGADVQRSFQIAVGKLVKKIYGRRL